MNNKDQKERVNEDIKEDKVRVVNLTDIDESFKEDNKVLPLKDAIKMADNNDLDLVEITRKPDPVVCKIMDYNKYKFEEKKLKKKKDKQNKKNKVKEIKLSPNIGDNDLKTKTEQGKKFLSKGMHVRFFIFFKGREIHEPERGRYVILKALEDLKEYGEASYKPKLEGSKMHCTVKPVSK